MPQPPRIAQNSSTGKQNFCSQNKSECRFSNGATNVKPNHQQAMEQAIPWAESHNNLLPFTLHEDTGDATQLIIPSPSFEEQTESPFGKAPELSHASLSSKPIPKLLHSVTCKMTASLQYSPKTMRLLSHTASSSKLFGNVCNGCFAVTPLRSLKSESAISSKDVAQMPSISPSKTAQKMIGPFSQRD